MEQLFHYQNVMNFFSGSNITMMSQRHNMCKKIVCVHIRVIGETFVSSKKVIYNTGILVALCNDVLRSVTIQKSHD